MLLKIQCRSCGSSVEYLAENSGVSVVCQACGTSNDTEPRKRCPRCAEWIHGLAKVCKHCGTEILSPSERLFVGYGIAFYLLIVGVVVIAVLFGYFVFMYNLFNLSKLLK